MSFLTFIKNVTVVKLNATSTMKPQHTAVPLNLHQGSAVNYPELELVLAQADGSIVPTVLNNQTISAVGTQRLFGLDVYHSYLTDGTSFIRTIAKNGVVQDITLFTANAEVVPTSKEEWEFWLGRYQRDSRGDFVRDAYGNTLLAEAGLIGWQQFQVDGPPAIVYNRNWQPSNVGIEPITSEERIVAVDGTVTTVTRESMEYARALNDTGSSELLWVSLAQIGDQASVNVYVGIPLAVKDLKVFAAS